MKRTILFSGGMDSVACWLRYPEARLVYVRIGAPYEEREIESLHARGLMHRVRMLSGSGRWLGEMADGMGRVPLRNLLFAVAAAASTSCDEVVLGATAGETSPDKSRHFARMASAAMSAAEGRSIRLVMPFRHLTKRQLVARLIRGATNEQHPLHLMNRAGNVVSGRAAIEGVLRECPSCYAPDLPVGYAGCGKCMSCVRRWAAMSLNGIDESYQSPPWQVDTTVKRGLLKYLRRTPVRDWWGVAKVNADLLAAKRRQANIPVGRF